MLKWFYFVYTLQLSCKQKLMITAVVSIVESHIVFTVASYGLLTAMVTAKNLIAPYTLEILLLPELCKTQATTVTACKGRTDIYTLQAVHSVNP